MFMTIVEANWVPAKVWAGGGAVNGHHLLPLVIYYLNALAPAAGDQQGIYLVIPIGGMDSQALRKSVSSGKF